MVIHTGCRTDYSVMMIPILRDLLCLLIGLSVSCSVEEPSRSMEGWIWMLNTARQVGSWIRRQSSDNLASERHHGGLCLVFLVCMVT
jgi:hypothetical protein